MAMNKGIPVINNFDLYAQKPLDSRLTIENEQELGELINKGAIYDGMIFYRKDAQRFFQAQYLESGLKISEFGGSSSGGTPTLSLVDMSTQKVRTTITESEKNNLANGVYNQVIYTSTFYNPFDVYSPCKIIVSNGLSGAFAQFDCTPNADKTSGTIQSFTIYDYTIGTKNANGEYPINIVKHQSLNVGGSSGENIIVIKGTINENEESLPTYTITLTEEQFNKIYDTDLPVVLSLEPNIGVLSLIIEKQLNNNVKEITIGLTQSSYSVVAGFTATETSKPTFTLNSLAQTLQITYLILFGLVYDNQKNNLYLTETNISATNPYSVSGYLNPDIEGLDKTKYFIPELHNETITWIEEPRVKQYYNHFIYLALETTTKGTATIRVNFTTTSNELINTLDKLKTALGETFTLGGNGSIVNGSTYGTTYMLNQTSITGVVNGAQSVFNFADGTLTITDSVKQA